MDEFGKDFDAVLKESVLKESKRLETLCTCSNTQQTISPDKGRKLVFDNFDFKQHVHHMTEGNQNPDIHWTTHMAVENRVDGNNLSNAQPPDEDLLKLENGRCMPTSREHQLQREDYITLVERMITEIPYLDFLKPYTIKHIPHEYSIAMAQKSDMTFLGMIYENENTSDGIHEVLKVLHQYLSSYTRPEDGEKVFGSQGAVADQLSVERGVNCLFEVCNGFTAEEKLEGLHFEVADWHAGNKFLKVLFKNFFSGSSSSDKCTLYSDRNLINRRNVKADVDKAVNPCRQFFELEVKARVIASAMLILGIDNLNGIPTQIVPANAKEMTTVQQRHLLKKIASQVVDLFVLQKDKTDALLNKVLTEEEHELARSRDQTEDGRFMCRFPGCGKTFAHNGKRKQDHEATHDMSETEISDIPVSSKIPKVKKEETDDMFNYQCSFLEYAMIIFNFFDAIKEGDGKRVVRCWKFQLPYLRNDSASTKYALEALTLVFQVNALLSPRDVHRFVWNRFACNNAGYGHNIPLDLNMEFLNRILKEVVRKLGPNAKNPKTIDRYCRAVNVTKVVLDNFDREISLKKMSGKHVRASAIPDLHKVIAELVSQKAFTWTPNREYIHYKNVQPSLLEGMDMHDMFKWINTHKKNIILAKKAR
ncbi:uncharacterized protein LOC114576306 [Exaiptasia diaphana]|uniref:DUF6589 domain-containing protein n=1 Tax=Exaiptasia diaphana TaxID=2652724 RepID=A0A913YVB8_EXADI|nr:uncharacterized protein LOC114576306 [Exaiptasia diaphana]